MFVENNKEIIMSYETFFNQNADRVSLIKCGKTYGRLTYQQSEYVNDQVALEYFEFLDNK